MSDDLVFSAAPARPPLYKYLGKVFMAGSQPVEDALRRIKHNPDILADNKQATADILRRLNKNHGPRR